MDSLALTRNHQAASFGPEAVAVRRAKIAFEAWHSGSIDRWFLKGAGLIE